MMARTYAAKDLPLCRGEQFERQRSLFGPMWHYRSCHHQYPWGSRTCPRDIAIVASCSSSRDLTCRMWRSLWR